MSVKRWVNQKVANNEAGHAATPAGYTWHYVEDTKTMQLVPRDLHSAVGHSGGVTAIKYGRGPET